MTRRIIWLESASDDLLELYDWIARQSDVDTAFSYTHRVEAFTDRLITVPHWGTPRDEIEDGLRSIVYRGRTIIFYRVVAGEDIEIVRVSHGGRDLDTMFQRDD